MESGKRKPRLIAVLILFCAAVATPCSFDPTPSFAFEVRPDAPVDRYVAGRLGIIQPTYARSYLVIAYRYMSGKTPSAAEREGFRGLLRDRLHEYPEDYANPGFRWVEARRAVRGTGSDPGIGGDRASSNYGWFSNCTMNAYATATATLNDRIQRFGVQHPGVRSWLDAQDTVFANCYDGDGRPKPAEASLPPLLRADRAYQIAAADFYAMRYGEARAKFIAIARDPTSPWQQTARLVAVRALLRKATLQSDGDLLDVADRETRAVLADPSAASIHEQMRDLLAFVHFRTRPRERFAEVVDELLRGAPNSHAARRDLGDYTAFLDREDLQLEPKDDLGDWIVTIRQSNFEHAHERWQETKKTHWLAAALMTAKKAGDDLLDAKVATTSPAYPTIAYHRARLLDARHDRDAAREELDRVLALKDDKLPTSARNRLLELRRPLARNLADYLRDAQPVPVGIAVEQRAEPVDGPVVPLDAAAAFNHFMPLDTLAVAARDKTVHANVRQPILVAAFTRALLLDRDDVAEELLPAMRAVYPTLAPRLERWRTASGPSRRFAAIDLIVHAPALRAYIPPLTIPRTDPEEVWHTRNRDTNWWCRDGLQYWEARYPDSFKPQPIAPPLFLDSNEAERAALRALGSGSTWMLRSTMNWARTAPKDRRVPEALAMAVQGTRWGCADDETAKLSQAAFNLLHAQYPNSQWARETKYWYTGRD